jgi:hypothetical protein
MKIQWKKVLPVLGVVAVVLLVSIFMPHGGQPAYSLPDLNTSVVETVSEQNPLPIVDDVSAVEEISSAVSVQEEVPVVSEPAVPETDRRTDISEDGHYTSKEKVALYIHTYGKLPENYITKTEAKKLGWQKDSDHYAVSSVAPGKSIGGDRFGNREGTLPTAKGRSYTECDIGAEGKKSRGAKRIVFSNDGLVYYTGDHYETFELLYDADGLAQ